MTTTTTAAVLGTNYYYAQYTGASWPPTTTPASSTNTKATVLRYNTGPYTEGMTSVLWDTTAIPSDATIVSASITFVFTGPAANIASMFVVADWGVFGFSNTIYGGAIGANGSFPAAGNGQPAALSGSATYTLLNPNANIVRGGYTNMRFWLANQSTLLGTDAGNQPVTQNTTAFTCGMTIVYTRTIATIFGGTLGLSGTLARSVAGFKSFTGSLGLSGSLFKIKPTIQPLAGSLGLSGNLIQGIGRYTPVEASLRIATKYSNKLLAVTKQLLSLRIKPH